MKHSSLSLNYFVVNRIICAGKESICCFECYLNYSLRFLWSLSRWPTFWWPLLSSCRPAPGITPYFYYRITTHHSP